MVKYSKLKPQTLVKIFTLPHLKTIYLLYYLTLANKYKIFSRVQILARKEIFKIFEQQTES